MPDLKAAEEFERESLRALFLSATASALLYKLSDWFGFAALSWATIVLMGGFASTISIPYLIEITRLCFLIVFFRCLAPFSINFLTRKAFFKGSLSPIYLCYKDKLRIRKGTFKWIFVVIQIILTVLTLTQALAGLHSRELKHFLLQIIFLRDSGGASSTTDSLACLNACSSTNATVANLFTCVNACFPESLTSTVDNLSWCISVFQWIVLGTCIFQGIFLLWAGVLERVIWSKTDIGLMKYHDEVMCRGLNGNIVKADEFDVLDFFLRSLGEDLAIRNIGPLEVKKQNLKLLHYLYSHPNGMQVVFQGLSSDDSVRQETAANMVGFWSADNMKRDIALLSRLSEKLGLPGKIAEAAANSFSELARTWKDDEISPLLQKLTANGGTMRNVVETVIDLVLNKRLPTLLVYMRLLDCFFLSSSVLEWVTTKRGNVDKIKASLLNIAKRQSRTPSTSIQLKVDSSIKPRTAFIAFSAWARLEEFKSAMDEQQACNPEGIMSDLNRDLATQTFLWYDEKARFQQLWDEFNNDEELGDWFARCEARGEQYKNL